MKRLLVDGMHGLGDNINQRPFVRALAERCTLYLKTPWPQLYCDLPKVRCCPTGSRLRTQRKNEQRRSNWSAPPYGIEWKRVFYGAAALARHSIAAELEQQMPLQGAPYVYDLPSFAAELPPELADKPIALVRPATVRTEWAADSRNCHPSYLVEAAKTLRQRGYFVVSVADLEDGYEWLVGEAPPADLTLHRGELGVEALLAVAEAARVIVSPVGWALPAGVAYRRPTIIIAGGRGAHNAPEVVTDPRQPLACLRWIMPDSYCRCTLPKHDCDKRISRFGSRFDAALEELVGSLRLEQVGQTARGVLAA